MTSQSHIIRTISDHRALLTRHGVSRVGLFGSYARHEQTAASDIDLLIDFIPGEERFDNLMAVCELLDSLFNDERVEVVTFNGLSPYIGPRILKEVMYV